MRPSILVISFGLVSALALASPSAHAGDLRDSVLPHLSGMEDPTSPDALRALGPGVADELVSMVDDDALPRTTRARALHSLGWFPSPATRGVLVAALNGSDSFMARKAAYALGTGWGEAAVPELKGALASDDQRLRDASARALGKIGGSAADAALSERLAVEEAASVRESITKALAD